MSVSIGMIVSSLIFLSDFFLLILKHVRGLGIVLSVHLTFFLVLWDRRTM